MIIFLTLNRADARFHTEAVEKSLLDSPHDKKSNHQSLRSS